MAVRAASPTTWGCTAEQDLSGWLLDSATNADTMFDMKTFTVRDLHRVPSAVLAACDREGEVRIRCRDGRAYRLSPETAAPRVISALPDFAARRRKLFPKPLTHEQTRMVDQMLRGE